MIERVLLLIKHKLNYLWLAIEWTNSILFSIIYNTGLKKTLLEVFEENKNHPFNYRELGKSDITLLYELIKNQSPEDLDYFKPHGFDLHSLNYQLKNRAFLMMGTFDGNSLVGYFFLRFFVNRKCFVGRIIDKSYRGHGIGIAMNNIMYEIAWRMGFRCLSTISKKNAAVVKAHLKNSAFKLIKELPDQYLLVEFVRGAGTKHE
ncbi:MAG: hypothetical protein IH591_14200 [Bacteroidales bacterium]|nr:hypothetical protein [Bacteroidales bacterium]